MGSIVTDTQSVSPEWGGELTGPFSQQLPLRYLGCPRYALSAEDDGRGGLYLAHTARACQALPNKRASSHTASRATGRTLLPAPAMMLFSTRGVGSAARCSTGGLRRLVPTSSWTGPSRGGDAFLPTEPPSERVLLTCWKLDRNEHLYSKAGAAELGGDE